MTNRRSFLRSMLAAASLPWWSWKSTHALAAPQAHLASDPLRPQFHLLPAKNWMNDPNGPIYWRGKYHMFFQYNPNAAIWGDMHWAHAVSADMIHWKHLPIALAPTPGGPDGEGVFSGTAVVDQGRVAMLYTGVQNSSAADATIKDAQPRPLRETQCLALALDDHLTKWEKLPQPVLANPPQGMQVNGFRDPSPWKEGDWWYTVIACGFPNQGGAVLLYRSKDLRSWEYMHIFASRQTRGIIPFESFDPWDVWECPEFFPLGDRHVLIFSTAGKAYWFSGHLDKTSMTFHPEQQGILDYGKFYAPKTQLDASGNRILWGWIQEARPTEQHRAAGWAGMMSLPRVLTLADDGRLRYSVANEATSLRGDLHELKMPASRAQLEALSLAECCGEVWCHARRGGQAFSLSVSIANEGSPLLTVAYDPSHPNQVLIDARPLDLSAGAELEMHMHIDGSVMEILINQQVAWTKRFYYAGRARDARLQWSGDASAITLLKIWRMHPISADRLTS